MLRLSPTSALEDRERWLGTQRHVQNTLVESKNLLAETNNAD
jgi:hypothetical protein